MVLALWFSVAGLVPDNFGINFKRQQRRNEAVAALLPLLTDLKIGSGIGGDQFQIFHHSLVANRNNLRFEALGSELKREEHPAKSEKNQQWRYGPIPPSAPPLQWLTHRRQVLSLIPPECRIAGDLPGSLSHILPGARKRFRISYPRFEDADVQ